MKRRTRYRALFVISLGHMIAYAVAGMPVLSLVAAAGACFAFWVLTEAESR